MDDTVIQLQAAYKWFCPSCGCTNWLEGFGSVADLKRQSETPECDNCEKGFRPRQFRFPEPENQHG